ncbi:MAG TPA: NAD(P)-binding domain-containing protein [Ktedonobacteraceae bacterium]|nr:NAD(P)-binding domain-containing protein [Ktedonobacteraceae bacterium]
MHTDYDYLVIGAGPAGLQLGYYLEKHKRNYLILEAQESPGSFFLSYPRSRNLISFNKVFSIYDDPEIQLRWDWNSLLTDNYSALFRDYSKDFYPKADDMVRYLHAFAAHAALKIQYTARVVRVARGVYERFHVTLDSGAVYSSRCLVVATGFSRPYIPAIPGIELAEGYENVSMRPEDFAGQRVLIIGKGNSGFEIANTMLGTAALIHIASPRPIQLAWNSRHPGHLRAEYTRFLDTYQLKLLNSSLDGIVNQIVRRGEKLVVPFTYAHANGEWEEMAYDRIIRCTGFQFDDSIFDETCRLNLCINDRFPGMTATWESTSVANLFFAGTLMQARDYKRASSAFIDGFRYNIRTLASFLALRYHNEQLPGMIIEATSEQLTRATFQRICRTSGLWAQFGYLCDLIVVDEQQRQAYYYYELPLDYIHESQFGTHRHYYTITFEWGSWQGDVFAIERHPRSEQAHRNAFLHPIVRRFDGPRLLAEHHILEDLFGMYCSESATTVRQSNSGRDIRQYHQSEHEQPLQRFFAEHCQLIR